MRIQCICVWKQLSYHKGDLLDWRLRLEGKCWVPSRLGSLGFPDFAVVWEGLFLVVLHVAELLGGLQNVGSSEGQTHWWSALLPWVQQIFWEASRLWGLQWNKQADDLPQREGRLDFDWRGWVLHLLGSSGFPGAGVICEVLLPFALSALVLMRGL